MSAIFILFLAYLIVPKVDIIEGVRPEDLIFLITLGFCFLQRDFYSFKIPTSVKYYLLFIGINFFSAALNYRTNGLNGILFSFRLFQYILWYPIMWQGCRNLSKENIVRGFSVVSVFLLCWGVLEFTGIIPKIGNFSGAVGRLSLNTGGPYEAAVLVAMLGYVVNGVVLTPSLLVIVVLTQARITTAAVAVGYGVTRPGRTALLAAGAGLAALLIAPQIDNVLNGSRFQQQASSYSMLGLIRYEWDVVPTFTDPALFREAFIDHLADLNYMPNQVGDLSFNIRAVRWSIVYKSILASPMGILFGFGPGAWGNALDGYHVRLAGEVGLIGVATFLCWLVQLFRESRRRSAVFYSLLVMSISSLFIDIFVSSKVMPLLWMFVALQVSRHPASMVGDGRERRQRGGAVQLVTD